MRRLPCQCKPALLLRSRECPNSYVGLILSLVHAAPRAPPKKSVYRAALTTRVPRFGNLLFPFSCPFSIISLLVVLVSGGWLPTLPPSASFDPRVFPLSPLANLRIVGARSSSIRRTQNESSLSSFSPPSSLPFSTRRFLNLSLTIKPFLPHFLADRVLSYAFSLFLFLMMCVSLTIADRPRSLPGATAYILFLCSRQETRASVPSFQCDSWRISTLLYS